MERSDGRKAATTVLNVLQVQLKDGSCNYTIFVHVLSMSIVIYLATCESRISVTVFC